jgi:hypothetical protein
MDKHVTAPETDKGRRASIGERIFDIGTYIGIAGFGTFFLTIPIAYAIRYGGGKKYYDATEKWLEKKNAAGPLSKALGAATVTMQGGNAILLPVGIAEHFKVPIATGINNVLGDKTDPALIEAAPPQTAGSLIRARIVAWATVFVSFFTAGSLFGKQFDAFETTIAKKYCDWIKKPTHALNAQGVMEETKAFRYGKMGALDVFATTAATSLLYFGGKFFARKGQEKREAKAEARMHMPPHADEAPLEQTSAAPLTDKPATSVSNVSRDQQKVAVTPETAAAL